MASLFRSELAAKYQAGAAWISGAESDSAISSSLSIIFLTSPNLRGPFYSFASEICISICKTRKTSRTRRTRGSHRTRKTGRTHRIRRIYAPRRTRKYCDWCSVRFNASSVAITPMPWFSHSSWLRSHNFPLKIVPAIQHSIRRSIHTYNPLRPNEIRLIDLHPGKWTDPVRCSLKSVNLSDKASYESLSYCWGLARSEEDVLCDNGSIPVTQNLSDALRQLRSDQTPRKLWIDAVCINQADITERGQQVSLMRDVFRLSDRTVVWLGEESHDSGLAIDLIHELAKSSRQGDRSQLPNQSAKVLALHDPAWRALTHLLQRPWFQRTWIVQEASVSKDIFMVCGGESIHWDVFVRAVQYAVELGVFIANGGSATNQALRLFETRSTFQQNRLPTLYDILLNSRSFQATDARDKVYGLLSLADLKSVQTLGVVPDYHVSTEDLYKAIAGALLKSSDLSAFHASGMEKSPDTLLPSWVPDWRATDPSSPLTSLQSASSSEDPTEPDLSIPKFKASAATASDPKFRSQGNLLGLDGIIVDEIEAIGTVSRSRSLRRVSYMFELWVQCRDVLEQLKNWEDITNARSKDTYITGEKQRDAYWKTLCAGRVPDGLTSAWHDPRYKYYRLICPLRSAVRVATRWFPRSDKDTWYNRFFYWLFRKAWKTFRLSPAKVERIGFPPQTRLSTYRRMIRTKKGYMALAPRFAKPGDLIGVFKGGKLPLVVRRDGEYLELIGESYVHGMMGGEAWDESQCELMWFK